jgi:hypothetical protein
MKNSRHSLADILRQLAEVIERNPAALEKFLSSVSSPPGKTAGFAKLPAYSDAERVGEILSDLQTATSRDEAARILRLFNLTRRELVELARARSVHVRKEDNVSRIEEKLIESIIGARLNSLAIRGERSAQ